MGVSFSSRVSSPAPSPPLFSPRCAPHAHTPSPARGMGCNRAHTQLCTHTRRVARVQSQPPAVTRRPQPAADVVIDDGPDREELVVRGLTHAQRLCEWVCVRGPVRVRGRRLRCPGGRNPVLSARRDIMTHLSSLRCRFVSLGAPTGRAALLQDAECVLQSPVTVLWDRHPSRTFIRMRVARRPQVQVLYRLIPIVSWCSANG